MAGELVVVLIPLAPAGLGAGAGAAVPRPGTLSQSEQTRGESSAYSGHTGAHCTTYYTHVLSLSSLLIIYK